MKKIIALLLVILISFTTFVSAQDSTKTYKPVTFLFDKITVVKDSTPVEKAGHFELTFSSTPGEIFFRDIDKESILRVTLTSHIQDESIQVYYRGDETAATVMSFHAVIRDMDVIFSTVLLDDKNKTIYAFGISLDSYSLLFKVVKDDN